MSARTTHIQLDHLAHRIAADGVAAHEPAVQHVARHALAHGIAAVAAGVLADPGEPGIARERAFSHVAAALERDHRPIRLAA